jgi:hypothetical protein
VFSNSYRQRNELESMKFLAITAEVDKTKKKKKKKKSGTHYTREHEESHFHSKHRSTA